MSEEKVITTEITCPHCNEVIVIERPAPQRRGALAGLTLEEMTDDQLKIEIRNAKSVLYKAEKRGAPAETIFNNQARVDAALAEKAKREAANAEEEPDTPDEEVTDEEAVDESAEGVYEEEY
jgi:hypothetical protein